MVFHIGLNLGDSQHHVCVTDRYALRAKEKLKNKCRI